MIDGSVSGPEVPARARLDGINAQIDTTRSDAPSTPDPSERHARPARPVCHPRHHRVRRPIAVTARFLSSTARCGRSFKGTRRLRARLRIF